MSLKAGILSPKLSLHTSILCKILCLLNFLGRMTLALFTISEGSLTQKTFEPLAIHSINLQHDTTQYVRFCESQSIQAIFSNLNRENTEG